jgi:tetratricopeptide (TPR) repeat protein
VAERYEVVHVDDLDRLPSFQDVTWLPVRRRLGIEAFGVNAFEGDAGKLVIEEHDEMGSGGSGRQEELYVVLRGAATFTIAGDEVDAAEGALVFIGDPAAKRKAVAAADGTVILALGATRGEAFTPSAWEWIAPSIERNRAGDDEGAVAVLEEGLRQLPDHPSILYNLACFEALTGKTDQALDHLERGLTQDPKMRAWARKDEDFASLRGNERFESAVAGEPEPGGSAA